MALPSNNAVCLSTKTHYRQTDQFQEMTYVDLKGLHQFTGWLKLGLAFRLTQMPSVSGDEYEYRPQLVSTFSKHWKPFCFSSTLRLEQRWFKYGKSHQRLYHNLFVNFPLLTQKFFKPIIGEELVFKLNGDNLHLARVYGGMGVYTAPHWGVELFYVWQSSKKPTYREKSDVLALKLKFKI